MISSYRGDSFYRFAEAIQRFIQRVCSASMFFFGCCRTQRTQIRSMVTTISTSFTDWIHGFLCCTSVVFATMSAMSINETPLGASFHKQGNPIGSFYQDILFIKKMLTCARTPLIKGDLFSTPICAIVESCFEGVQCHISPPKNYQVHMPAKKRDCKVFL